MKYVLCVVFLFLVSCSSIQKKTYICGDHDCIDKKEFKEYFAKNLIIELKIDKKDKNSTVDLVKLNTSNQIKNTKSNVSGKQDIKLGKKQQKIKDKEKRAEIKGLRKLKKIEEKNKIKEEKKLVKLNKANDKYIIKTNNSKNIKIEDNSVVKKFKKTLKKINSKNLIDNSELKSVKSTNQISICQKIDDCDIDKISDLLIKKGKEKDYPSITSK